MAAALTAGLLVAQSGHAAAPLAAPGFVVIGSPANGWVSGEAYDVSADGGTVVGTLGYQEAGALFAIPEAFRWTAAGGIELLPADTVGLDTRSALGVSSDGSALVGVEGQVSYLWTDLAGRLDLTPWAPGSTLLVSDLSGDGQVVVGRVSSAPLSADAVRLTVSPAVLQPLGHLPGEGLFSAAWAVSADGSTIVGECRTSSDVLDPMIEAFRWTEAGGMVGLGDLPGGTFFSTAAGVSADGSVIVGSSATDEGLRAFRWTEATGIQSLGDFVAGFHHSHALAVSDDGQIIVGWVEGLPSGAFVWTASEGMRDLSTVLDEAGATPTLPLTKATGVSHDGGIIVGTGVRPWVASIPVPEPSSTTLQVAGLCAIGAIARLSRRGRRHSERSRGGDRPARAAG